ncbi:MAG: pectinesterase family protein [Paludibacter sp.]
MKIKLFTLALLILIVANLKAAPFRYIVATDGTGDYSTIQAALTACPDNERSIVFVKNGIYDEQVTLGTKTAVSKKLISLIGESYGGVVITHNQYRASSGSPTYEDVCTVKLYANDFYAENITIQNTATGGMAEALFSAGDRQTFKNCQVLGYQDAYRAKKGVRCYFKNSLIQGAVDFIYAGGTVFFDDCTINCVKGGGHIVAPEDRYKYIAAASTTTGKDLNLEFIFRNCIITANADVAANSYDLGRPWNVNSGAYYLNCRLGPHIKAAGWATMGGNETTASFGEYNSMDKNGIPVSTAGRISWSFQLKKEDVDNFLTPNYVYAQLSATPYDPVTSCVSPAKPTLTIVNNTISWNALSDASGYIVFKDGKYVGSTTATTYTDVVVASGTYTVKAINALGVLSDTADGVTADVFRVNENQVGFRQQDGIILLDSKMAKVELYNVNGIKVCQSANTSSLSVSPNIKKGIYVIRILTMDGGLIISKLEV